MHYDKLYPASYKYIKLFYIITSIALLFGQAKRASRERASEGRGARGEGRFPLRLADSPARLCVIARLVSLAQIGELACKLLLA